MVDFEGSNKPSNKTLKAPRLVHGIDKPGQRSPPFINDVSWLTSELLSITVTYLRVYLKDQKDFKPTYEPSNLVLAL